MIPGAPDDLRESYLRTEISVALPDEGWVAAADALDGSASPMHVLTAWNPGSERPAVTVNRLHNRLLRAWLGELGVDVLAAIGASPEGDHFEESFATIGLDRST